MPALLLYTYYLSFMSLNDDVVDVGKGDGICLLTFVVADFSGLFIHPSIFSIYR